MNEGKLKSLCLFTAANIIMVGFSLYLFLDSKIDSTPPKICKIWNTTWVGKNFVPTQGDLLKEVARKFENTKKYSYDLNIKFTMTKDSYQNTDIDFKVCANTDAHKDGHTQERR